jgi:hypothetical protein
VPLHGDPVRQGLERRRDRVEHGVAAAAQRGGAEREQHVVGHDRHDEPALVELEADLVLHALRDECREDLLTRPLQVVLLLSAARWRDCFSSSAVRAACRFDGGVAGLLQPGAALSSDAPLPRSPLSPRANFSNLALSTTDSANMTMNSAMSTVSMSA